MQSHTPDTQRPGAARPLLLLLACAILPLLCFAIPMYVIRPFRPQDAGTLAFALTVRGAGPWISAICVVLALWAGIWCWRRTRRVLPQIAAALLVLLTLGGAWLTRINIFEIMFHPYSAPAFGPASAVLVDADDKVLAVSLGGEAHAYPIRTMGYHHIVNDTVGGVPIAATYCTLCHTGLVWKRVMDGKTLHFRLAGINNGNALMHDEETNTIWQQSTGVGIFGLLKGRQLELVHSNELTFALWRAEQPAGRILLPDAPYAAEYDPKDWEAHVARTHTVIDTSKSGIGPHELMLGVTYAGQSKAYPVAMVLSSKVIEDQIGGEPILLVVGPDQASIRVFDLGRPDATGPRTFVRMPAGTSSEQLLQDGETGSVWNFKGCAVEGKSAGQCLTELDANKDYWFDWLNHHPTTLVFHG